MLCSLFVYRHLSHAKVSIVRFGVKSSAYDFWMIAFSQRVERALEKFFLIAPVLSRTLDEFMDGFGIRSDGGKQHHEITGSKLSSVINHASKLFAVFREHGDPFVEEEAVDELYNLLTKEVIDEKVSRDIHVLERDKIGQQNSNSLLQIALLMESYLFGTK